MCNFTFLLLTKSILFVFQLNPTVMYQASDNSLPSALLQAISAYYQAKLWNGPPSAADQTFPSWDLRLKKKCFITADQSAIQRHLEDGIITRKKQNDPSQKKSISEGLVSEKKPLSTYSHLQFRGTWLWVLLPEYAIWLAVSSLIHDYQKPCLYFHSVKLSLRSFSIVYLQFSTFQLSAK